MEAKTKMADEKKDQILENKFKKLSNWKQIALTALVPFYSFYTAHKFRQIAKEHKEEFDNLKKTTSGKNLLNITYAVSYIVPPLAEFIRLYGIYDILKH